ncbi:MAG: GlmU family protein [Bacteroidales bacterium]|nr:GlmU family protein [Bacteroidales bacterium]MBN2818226.1 GlmU family protein [Bacteroidales bacterium]
MQNLNIILFDKTVWEDLLPLTFTRSAADLRIGITTLREKWETFFPSTGILTEEYLAGKYSYSQSEDSLYINVAVIPNDDLVEAISNLQFGQLIAKNGFIIAFRKNEFTTDITAFQSSIEYNLEIKAVKNTWDIFELNDFAIRSDFPQIIQHKKSASISTTNRVLGEDNIFIEEGAKLEFATINASEGPVYIGKNAEVMEGALIRGPLALCEHACIKMGAKIYGATTIGPWCKVAGEIHNSVLTGYSNKGHDGFLGNAVLGEWCNIGADSNNSNLKNNYDLVKLWAYKEGRFVSTGLQFCGLIMGDHSKCGINTMFNTGTVVGVSANIYGSGFPRNFIPSFSWGGALGFKTYNLDKAIETAKIVYSRRKLELSASEINILQEVFDRTAKYRK